MKSYLISDNQDVLIGMRLAGIRGEMVRTPEEVIEALDRILEDSRIEMVIVTEDVLMMAQEKIMELKIVKDRPLIIQIPSRGGPKNADYITKRIRESIGLKI